MKHFFCCFRFNCVRWRPGRMQLSYRNNDQLIIIICIGNLFFICCCCTWSECCVGDNMQIDYYTVSNRQKQGYRGWNVQRKNHCIDSMIRPSWIYSPFIASMVRWAFPSNKVANIRASALIWKAAAWYSIFIHLHVPHWWEWPHRNVQ